MNKSKKEEIKKNLIGRTSRINSALGKISKPQIKKKRLFNSVLIASFCAFIISILFLAGFLSNAQLSLSDNLHGGDIPLNTIKIVAIDDHSLQEIGRWPWSRQVFAKLVDTLSDSGAEIIGIDVAFFEPSDNESDHIFAQAMKKAGNVILPVEFTKFNIETGQVTGKGLMLPPGELFDAPRAKGYVNIITDRDGVTRAVNMDLASEYDSFAKEIYDIYWGRTLPANALKGRVLVNFVGKPGTFDTYSFTDIISGNFDADTFKDAVVFVGATSPDMHDDYFVPTSSGKAMPGVEIHANTLQMLIKQSFLQKEAEWEVILSIFLIAIITSLLVYKFHVWVSAMILTGMWVGYTIFGIIIFSKGTIMNFVYAPFTIVASYLATVLYYYLSEEKSRKMVKHAFEKYVSPVIIEHMLEHPDKLNLGGERREITVFFSDIRGFTTISEKLDPEALVKLLNEYLSAMTEIVMNNKGVVDKYMGDAIMAFWGAPLKIKNHAALAVKTCIEMEEKLKELQKKWNHEGVPSLEIGIGLNSGPAVVGNMGSYDRFDYTAMGDTINLGARLESINKQYGTRMIISESTKKNIEQDYAIRELDAVIVKGKNVPITIYELIRRKKDVTKEVQGVILHFENGLKLYKKQKWNAAIAEFEKVLKLRSEDGPAKTFIERCEFLKTPGNSPGNNWDGVWTMKTK